jgi:hypothetical protein
MYIYYTAHLKKCNMLSYVQAAVLNNSYNSIEGSESNRKYGKKQANNNLAFLEEGRKVRTRTEETKGGCNEEEEWKAQEGKNISENNSSNLLAHFIGI